MFDHPSFSGHESVTYHFDPITNLKAIIAVHSSKRGSALGGCRMFNYASDQAALNDVLRLSQGMSYKTALAGLPLGGGKSVIIGNPHTQKTPEMMQAMGRFVDSLQGTYLAAEDSGTGVADLQQMATQTAYVAGVDSSHAAGGDPSPSTALGVFKSIQTAVRWALNRELQGIRVAVQGVGNVGLHLVQHLIAAGALVYVADVNLSNLQRAVAMGAVSVELDEITSISCDVFAPCAMGAVINERFIDNVNAKIVAGAANNQLANPGMADKLLAKGVVYAPDYLINAGGIIDAYYQTQGGDGINSVQSEISAIATRLEQVLETAKASAISPAKAADSLAEHILRSDS